MTFVNHRPALLLAATLLTTLSACAASDGQSATCFNSQQRQSATLDYIIDGDTLVLNDKRTVRVIGINTPELRPAAQPKAKAARDAAESLLSSNTKIWLYPGDEPSDRHGRTLAHVITQNGANLAEHLLTKGLAASSAVYPNTRCAEHYQQLEQQARSNKSGLWRDTHPWQLFDKRINRNRTGFRLVTSNVKSIKANNRYHHLQLENGLRVSMTNKVATEVNAHKLQGERLTVRGWVQWHKNKASLKLHHASNLQRHNN